MPRPIRITDALSVEDSELEFSFIRSSGPGGQNVNKVSSAVQLRFDLSGSPSLPSGMKSRVAKLAGSKLTNNGVIVLTASQHRSQQQNREEAVERLLELLRQAATPPRRRIATRPTLGSKTRRLNAKAKHGALKSARASKPVLD